MRQKDLGTKYLPYEELSELELISMVTIIYL